MHPVCLWWARRSCRSGPVWGVGEGEVCYRQTRPGIPGFRPDPAWHSRISTWPGLALPDFDRSGPAWGWGRERFVIDRLGSALPDFDLTRPDTPGFRPTGPSVGGGGRGLLQTDPARHSRISTDRAQRGWGRERSVIDRPGPTLSDFNLTRPGTPGFRPTGPGVGGGGGRGLLQTDSARFFAHCFIGLSFPPPPKTSVIDIETYWINIYQLHREHAVIGRILQALPTQTDTTVALIYKIRCPCELWWHHVKSLFTMKKSCLLQLIFLVVI